MKPVKWAASTHTLLLVRKKLRARKLIQMIEGECNGD
jgi:hypothetical protein